MENLHLQIIKIYIAFYKKRHPLDHNPTLFFEIQYVWDYVSIKQSGTEPSTAALMWKNVC